MSFFFFTAAAATHIYTLSLHDALPISREPSAHRRSPPHERWGTANECSHQWSITSSADCCRALLRILCLGSCWARSPGRSEEHTSELQSQSNLVCRLLLEKKKCNSLQI